MARSVTDQMDALFDMPAVTPPRKPKGSKAVGDGPVTYSSYKVKNAVRCEDCMQVALEANLAGEPAPLARDAKHQRKQGKTRLLLCAEHKNIRERDDAAAQLLDTLAAS